MTIPTFTPDSWSLEAMLKAPNALVLNSIQLRAVKEQMTSSAHWILHNFDTPATDTAKYTLLLEMRGVLKFLQAIVHEHDTRAADEVAANNPTTNLHVH